jgi:AcrR family transcriptional regulator
MTDLVSIDFLAVEVTGKARRGRPPTASREDVLRLARALFLEGTRLDMTVLARRLGLGRATIYRWFGSRDSLLGEVIATEFEALVADSRRHVRRRGAEGLLGVFDRVNRTLSRSTALRRLLEQERDSALRLLTSSAGPVQPRAVAAIEGLIAAEVSSGDYAPPAEPAVLAYAIVRLAEAFLYNDAAFGIRGDHERLREVEAALLGLSGQNPAGTTAPGRAVQHPGSGRAVAG